MKTVRRIYNFLAPDGTAAHDWIDRIQSCIQWSFELMQATIVAKSTTF